MAERLAARGMGVLAVARRAERLEQLATSARGSAGVIVPVVADLTEAAGIAATLAAAAGVADGIDLLVNNAGFGIAGEHLALPLERELACIQLNVVALVELTRRLLPGMVARGRGGVINIASTIAFSPVPYFATYAATKAYVLHYTEALAVELRGTGVHALAVCPGPVRTEFESVAGNGRFQRSIPNLAASRVADATLSAWDRGRTVAVVGAVNRLITWFNGLLPRAIVRSMMGKLARPTTVSLPPGLESHR